MTSNLTLSTRLNKLLSTEKYSDCQFIIDNTKINCHKLILSSASPVFEAMFYGPLAETSCIKIIDINLDVFQLMIKFIYTDQLEEVNVDEIDILIELYYTAEKYLIPELIKICLNKINASLRYTNIFYAIDLSVTMNLIPIITICLKFLQNCCLNNQNFNLTMLEDNHISKETLNFILKLNIKEQNINLINLIKSWCSNECHLNGLDGKNIDHVKQIMIGVDVPDEIYSDVVNFNPVKVSENSFWTSNLSWIQCQRTYYKASKPLIIGDDNQYEFNTNLSCDKFIIIKSFQFNSKLFPLLPFYGNKEKYTENVKIQIKNNDLSEIIYEKNCVITNVSYNSMFNVVIDRPVVFNPDNNYNVKLIWDENGNQTNFSEYPRSIFSLNELNFCTFYFDLLQYGSILSGVQYAILNN